MSFIDRRYQRLAQRIVMVGVRDQDLNGEFHLKNVQDSQAFRALLKEHNRQGDNCSDLELTTLAQDLARLVEFDSTL